MNRFSDIVPPSKRKGPSNIQLPSRSIENPGSGRRRFPFLTFAVVFVVIAGSVAALVYFSTAKVTITPNVVSANVQSSFTATRDTGTLPFQIVTAQKIASKNVAATGTKTVSSSASGPITIYNTQPKAQRLIANTRFATTAGLVFRIHSAVTVPGGTAAKPGSVTATVYADQPGASYNVDATSFTLPGLAGSPQSSQVYAKSSAKMTGGASGTVAVVDPSTEAQTRSALVDALGPQLLEALESQIPGGYILLSGAATTSFEALPAEPAGSAATAEVKQQGTIRAVVFPSAAIAHALASSIEGAGYQGEPVTLASTDGLNFSPSGAFPTTDTASFSFSVRGPASFIYTVDPSRIAAAIAGKTRSLSEVALTNYPEVKRAVLVLRPFWRQSFPEDPASITVVIQNP